MFYAVSSVAKRAKCFLKSAKLIESAVNIASLGSANKAHRLNLFKIIMYNYFFYQFGFLIKY